MEPITNKDSVAELNIMEKRILNDFYLSFRISQGKPSIQESALIYAARNYDPDKIGDVSILAERLGPHIAGLDRPQKEHTEYGSDKTGSITFLDQKEAQTGTAGFQAEWKFFLAALARVNQNETTPAGTDVQKSARSQLKQTPIELLAVITQGIASRERYYQGKGRPNRMPGADPHESLLRAHVFEGKRTGSETYDKMYIEIKKMLDGLGIGMVANGQHKSMKAMYEGADKMNLDEETAFVTLEAYLELVRSWELKHPGQKFNPAEAAT